MAKQTKSRQSSKETGLPPTEQAHRAKELLTRTLTRFVIFPEAGHNGTAGRDAAVASLMLSKKPTNAWTSALCCWTRGGEANGKHTQRMRRLAETAAAVGPMMLAQVSVGPERCPFASGKPAVAGR